MGSRKKETLKRSIELRQEDQRKKLANKRESLVVFAVGENALKKHNEKTKIARSELLQANGDHGRLIVALINTKLLDLTRKPFQNRRDEENSYFRALEKVAKFSDKWIRQPEDWVCNTKNPDRQFSSIIRHLFAKYDIPAFMNNVWFNPDRKNTQIYWFINIGKGENIRKQMGLPIELTKKMAHQFVQAPNNYNIEQAFRWAQIHGMCGNERVCHGVLGTKLVEELFLSEIFWVSVIQFFINNPMLDTNQYGPIVDYIYNQKYTPIGNIAVDGRIINLGPPQPGLSMHRRNPETLLSQVERWHKDLNKKGNQQSLAWKTCGINGMEWEEGNEKNKKIHIVKELLSSSDLQKEGKAMHNCVSSYGHSCNNYRSAIYSYSILTTVGIEKRLTVEVNIVMRQIVSIRSDYNKEPKMIDMANLRKWAQQRNLGFASYL